MLICVNFQRFNSHHMMFHILCARNIIPFKSIELSILFYIIDSLHLLSVKMFIPANFINLPIGFNTKELIKDLVLLQSLPCTIWVIWLYIPHKSISSNAGGPQAPQYQNLPVTFLLRFVSCDTVDKGQITCKWSSFYT